MSGHVDVAGHRQAPEVPHPGQERPARSRATGSGNPPALATTFEYLEQHASAEPARTALIVDGQSFPFGRFHADAMRFSWTLARLGVARGQLVLVSHPYLYIEWLLLIACENVGAVSASYPSNDALAATRTQRHADHIFAHVDPPATEGSAAFVRLDAEWLDSVFRLCTDAVVDHPRVALRPDEPQRLTHSSGSTGTAKPMLLRLGAQEEKLRIHRESGGYSRDTRLLAALPFTVNSAYLLATVCLRLGALVVAAPLPVAVAAHRVTCFETMPIALHRMLAELPHDFVKPTRLDVGVVGAPLTRTLRAQALRTLCTRIGSRYATNEVWPIVLDMNEDGEGALHPEVDVRILDEDGHDVAKGQPGRVAARSPLMVESYLDEPEATQAHFRDGWFLTGDFGALLPGRRLRLAGRADEMLNCGGLKLHPREIEGSICAIDGVVEVAVTSVTSDRAIDDLCVALVLARGVALAKLAPRIAAATTGWQQVRLKVVPALPTGAQGKLDRTALRRLFDFPA